MREKMFVTHESGQEPSSCINQLALDEAIRLLARRYPEKVSRASASALRFTLSREADVRPPLAAQSVVVSA